MAANKDYASVSKVVPPVEFIKSGTIDIAVRQRPASKTLAAQGGQQALFWLSGYLSDIEGTKAQAVDAFAEAHGIAATRFDYSGHGRSGGDFYQGNISTWLSQALNVFDKYYGQGVTQPILVGSSMGGWIALRMAQELQKRGRSLGGLMLIAPAPDFTETLVKPSLQPEQKQQLEEKGFFTVKEGEHEIPYSRALLDDGVKNQVLNDNLLQLNCPIHIMQGVADEVVPYQHTLELMEYLPLDNVTLSLVKDGDHRLSRPQDITFLQNLLENFIKPI